ncbi:MAG: hypothetical protein CMJ64_08430 [Planctomycetaceae bacterium]|jgi:hypothetical protein|nr:hypothetical protein [Planctomycetaceae bacterium]
MSSADTINVLNRLVGIHNRSLPVYLTYASPAWERGDEAAREVLANISTDHTETVDRLAAMIVENGGTVDNGKFPIYYTGYHDLSFDFLLVRMILEQKQDITTIEQSITQLELSPLAKAAAQEALGAAKGHLESLEELKQASAS